MIELSLKADFTRMERALQVMARDQVPFAAARSLNDVARSASVRVNAGMDTVFDNPTSFTDRAAVAPISLAAQKDRLAAVVTLRPIQARYLLREEVGGTRVPAENTRKPDARALVLPGRGLKLDSHGNIPRGAVQRLQGLLQARSNAEISGRHAAKKAAGKRVKSVPKRDRGVFYVGRGNPRLQGGFWQRLPGHRLRSLILFEPETDYPTKRLGYHACVQAVATAEWTSAFRKRLDEAMRSAR